MKTAGFSIFAMLSCISDVVFELDSTLPRIIVTSDNVSDASAVQGHAPISVSSCIATKVADPLGHHEGQKFTIEYINDSGAGRHIASERAFLQQGVPRSFMNHIMRPSTQKIQFDTGGGLKDCCTSVGVESILP